MQIPVKRPVLSCDQNPASLSRLSLPCKAIYAAAKRGRSKQDSPIHGSLVPRPGRPPPGSPKSKKKKRKGERRARRKKEAVCQAPGVSAAGCCVLPSAFEKAPRTLCWRRAAILRLEKRASGSRLPALMLSSTLDGRTMVRQPAGSCTVAMRSETCTGLPKGQRSGWQTRVGVSCKLTTRHRQT